MLFSALFLAACTPAECDPALNPGDTAADTGAASDTAGDSASDTDAALTEEELDAMALWKPSTVEFVLAEGKPPVSGDQLSIFVADAISALELIDGLQKAQDHNSSRSNKTASVASSLEFGGESDETGRFTARWDGGDACTEVPCPSEAARNGELVNLVVEGSSLLEAPLSMQFAHTLPVDEDLGGYTALAQKGRGHVTVLKAAANGEGGIVVRTEAEPMEMAIYDGDTLVYESAPASGELVTVNGAMAASWPKGFVLTPGERGVWVSFTW